ncbi:SulP family inorganic anion transporter [Xanthovirga aplysinae]|uniref:SulP family inorganic anion transporter n=1 Tax=Xanthovirga aplysinae TaxID=2529853 RepID=UPI0012BC26AC|nr:SulP family inorganic anion transporter [Xanthovirga aplysinae]MTI29892.1 SulP family inorganic anion transporter [Xanthovirga aplysinae]
MFEIYTQKKANLKDDILSGLTVALALVPEAVAFSFVAGVDPMVGLYAAFMVGLITAVIGGRPGMISGATGALAVVMVALVKDHGVEYLFATVVLMGIFQVLAGVLKLGKFIRLIPHPVMLGFVNGLAIVIFLAQLGQFKTINAQGVSEWLTGSELWTMGGLVLLTMAIIHFLPKLTRQIPSSLVAIVTVTLLVTTLGLNTRSVFDFAGKSLAGGLPEFHIPLVPFNLETFKIILPYSLILAAIGLIESLMTLTLVDEITESRGKSNQECIAQGTANIVTGFFGGMGGCAMIGQSMINVNSGGRGRLSGIVAALALLSFIIFASGLIEMIPLAALVGVMFMVVIGTFEWSSFRIIRKIPKADAFVLILVSVVTVFTDLAIAVAAGVIVSALSFVWKTAKKVQLRTEMRGKVKHYILEGPLFFGAIQDFNALFDVKEDPAEVVLDFRNSQLTDHSALEAVNSLVEKYQKAGKKLTLHNLSDDCLSIVNKAGNLMDSSLLVEGKKLKRSVA